MNILFLLSWKYPAANAATKRIQCYADGLKMHDNNVEILSIAHRAKNIIFFYLSVLIMPYYTLYRIKQLKKKPQIILLYTFGWFTKLLLVVYGKITSIKVVFEVNEKPYSIVGSKRDNILKYFVWFNNWFLTRIVYPMTDGFVVISVNLERFVSKHKSSKAKLVRIPIVVDYETYQRVDNEDSGVKPYIFHSATLNDNKDGISDVIEALGLVIKEHNQPLHFYITSKSALSSTKNNVQKIIDRYKIQDFVHYLGNLDEGVLQGYQKNCDFVVINKVDSEQNRYNFATKIGEYCALGKPIITTEVGEVSNFFEDAKNCLFISQNNPVLIAEKIMYLINNKDIALAIGDAAKMTAANEFDYKVNAAKLHNFFKSVL